MQYHEIDIKMFPAKSGDCFFIEFIREDFIVNDVNSFCLTLGKRA